MRQQKANRDKKLIRRKILLGNRISIKKLLETVKKHENAERFYLSVESRNLYNVWDLALHFSSPETDQEWSARLQEVDRKAEAGRKRREAAQKKERAEYERLKSKYEFSKSKEEKIDE